MLSELQRLVVITHNYRKNQGVVVVWKRDDEWPIKWQVARPSSLVSSSIFKGVVFMGIVFKGERYRFLFVLFSVYILPRIMYPLGLGCFRWFPPLSWVMSCLLGFAWHGCWKGLTLANELSNWAGSFPRCCIVAEDERKFKEGLGGEASRLMAQLPLHVAHKSLLINLPERMVHNTKLLSLTKKLCIS